MKSYLLPPGFPGSGSVEISGDDHHYLCHVLRCRVGDRLQATDGRGGRFILEVEGIGTDRLVAGVHSAEQAPASGQPNLHLLQCLPKGPKMDQIVRQATEAGVWRIVPLLSRYAVPRLKDAGEAARKQERWRRIAREALQQSGAPRLPEIDPPAALADFIGREELSGTRIFLHPGPPQQGSAASGSLHALLAGAEGAVFLLVGPEGGLAPEEVDLLLGKGFDPVRVQGPILRSETAALFALAAAQIILKERAWWKLAF